VRKLVVIAMILLGAASSLGAQAAAAPGFEVQESSGFVEALLPELGWRQAVIGRQLPAGAVVTAWTDARATIGYGDSVLTLEPFSHLGVLAVGNDLVRVSLLSGGVKVQTASLACEVEFRGMVIRIEKGTAVLSDEALSVQDGTVTVTGAQDKPIIVPAGTSLLLITRPEGPVFPSTDPWSRSTGK
jgi:hypothetical protein